MLMAKNASGNGSTVVRHHPEQILLYQIFEQYYDNLHAHMEKQGRLLTRYVQKEFVFLAISTSL